MLFFLESYGCAMSRNESEMVRGYLEEKGFNETADLIKADFVLINACGVKEITENRMIKRINELFKNKNKNSKLIVFGCLAKINPERIKKISEEILLAGPDLIELSNLLKINGKNFFPLIPVKRFNNFISIISIAEGCLGKCSYCATVNARGKLKSHSVKEIKNAFERELKTAKEIWLTAQDTGAYGFDLKTNLAELIKELLKVKGDYRIRVGMMNPLHLKKFIDSYIELFSDERLFKFVHLPVQSGSNKILKEMKRGYSSNLFLSLVKKLRKKIPEITVSTDVIVGFPGESEKDFNETVEVLEKSEPGIVNISRYGLRPETAAALMKNQVEGRIKKKRSRILADLCPKYSLKENKKLVGKTVKILVSEKGSRGNFVGRTSNYRPFVVKKDLRGKFVEVKITSAKNSFVSGEIKKVF
ncbi:MAG: tRNA (N(6)-L-threonylcarbamoyladenosine(37)-C(2))-methylthiotransferase [Candidatus Diapherotrites archaeon]|nr:tRNA (N(6)-L-threonylcarbamoyladenosine(37)-C(2))-methylthiotransferase [Candidatus Diapherotrites archaeon]